MKKLLFTGLIGLLLASCSSNDVVNPDNNKTNTGEQKYLAFSIVSNNLTSRGDDDATTTTEPTAVYDAGDEYLNVKDGAVAFFFFNADGSAFAIDGTKNYKTGTGINTWSDGTNSKVSNYVVTLESMKGDTPTHVIAVLNSTVTFDADSYSLDDLKAIVLDNVATEASENVEAKAATPGYTETDGTKYFVMSNSVYDNNGDIVATPIEALNFGKTADEAKDNPVTIYVERVVGKVTIKDGNITEDGANKFKLENSDQLTYADGSKIGDVYAVIQGWNIFNTARKTPLFKKVNGYTGTWTWNDKANYRSFWSLPLDEVSLNDITLNWETMKATDFKTGRNYPFENTYASTTEDINTNAIFAVQLQDKDGKAIQLARWLSKYYTQENLANAIATYFSNTVFYADGTPIKAADIKYTRVAADANKESLKSYQVAILLNTEKTWYGSDGKELSKDDLAKLHKNAPVAEIWTDGMCYYYTPIKHNIAGDVNAIVRNHWYQLTVKTITGVGTPVFDKKEPVDPTKPDDNTDDEQWYLDAKIAIQNWRLITQDINLE